MASAQGQLTSPVAGLKLHQVTSGPRSEHISLETAPEQTAAMPSLARKHKVLERFELRSPVRGLATELKLLEQYFLSVHSVRRRSEPRNYLVDLRFANPQPVRVRNIAWVWLSLGSIFAAGAALYLGLTSTFSTLGWIVSATAIACSLGSFALAYLRTTESLRFTSVHGNATLVSITGGLGSCRSAKKFFVALIKNISAARATAAQQKQEYLRDEMREHFRLKELGVLTDAEYEMSKQMILRAHN